MKKLDDKKIKGISIELDKSTKLNELDDTILDFKKKIDTCASSPHINAKLHDVPAQHENLRQAQYHANLDYDAAPKWIAIGSVECRSSNGGGVPETPPTQQNRNGIFKF